MDLKSAEFYLPKAGPAQEATWGWYQNIPRELAKGFLAKPEKCVLSDYYTEVGLLRDWRRSYFCHHFSKTFDEAADFLLGAGPKPCLIDLGCGSGTQSLYFALLGAHVHAIDHSAVALSILSKRAAFYAQLAERPLLISTHQCNVFEFDFSTLAPIDGVYSMFAFNMMQPSAKLLDRIVPCMSGSGRIAIIDGNHDNLGLRLLRQKRDEVWTPTEFGGQLQRRGFLIRKHRGGVSLPAVFWNLKPKALWRTLDRLMSRNWHLALSHQILAQRNGFAMSSRPCPEQIFPRFGATG